MVRSSKLVRRRCQHHLVEQLEERRLMSLTIDMRIDVGNAANTDPASIIDNHTIKGAQAGDVYAVQIWAVVNGTDTNATNDSLDLLYGSLIASDFRTGGTYFGAVQGTFAVPTLEPDFTSSTYEAAAGVQYTDANGNTDVGSTSDDTSTPQDFFHPVQGSVATTASALTKGEAGITSLSVTALGVAIPAGTTIQLTSGGSNQTTTLTAAAAVGDSTLSVASFTANAAYASGSSVNALPPTNYLSQGQAGAGEEQELATTTFTVNSVVSGPPTTLEFELRPQITGEVSAIWYEDGTAKDTLDGDTVAPSTGITITEPDTIAPTATASLSPILGSTPSYQFTVEYSDNQALDTTSFQTGNILVTGPNGYSQTATYIADADADASASPQYDPYNATYQITPPDGNWSIADNGQYAFLLEPNQVSDQATPTPNYAAPAIIGGGPLTVDFIGVVSISPATTNIGENSTTPATFTVTRTDAANDGYAGAMTVGYTVGGTAAAGTNYQALSGSVTIPAGQSSAAISVQPIDDNTIDADTDLTLTLSPGSTYVLGGATGATLTINNTDTVTATIASEAIARSSSDQTVEIPVTLSAAAATAIYVDYSTSDGTAVSGTDYTPTNSVLMFPAGTTTENIPVVILGASNSADKTFDINLTVDPRSADEVTIAGSPATETITDVVPASLSPLLPTPSSSINGGTEEFTVTLAGPSTQTVTVNYATADGSAAAGTDYTAESGTLTFAPGVTTQTVDVPLLPVIRSNAGKTFTFGITGGNLTSVAADQGTATVTLQQPDFTYEPIDPKKGYTYFDSSGNKVVVKVRGVDTKTFVGNVLFPTGPKTTDESAVGITLDGTTATSVLTISTRSTSMVFIDVNGSLKQISAKGVSLAASAATSVAPYFQTSGVATTVVLGSLSGGNLTSSTVKTLTAGNLTDVTVSIAGAAPARMTFANIEDSSITDEDSNLNSFSATQWLSSDSSESNLLSVAGLKAMNIKGTFAASVSADAIGTINIKGLWSNSLVEGTSVKKMSVGTASNGTLLANVNPSAAFPPAPTDLSGAGQINAFSVTSKAANAFSGSRIEGQFLGTISLAKIDPDNSGNIFGVAATGIKSITGTDSKEKFSLKNVTSQAGTAANDQDFVVELIT